MMQPLNLQEITSLKEKGTLLSLQKRESDQINGMQNRMNLRLMCENIQTLQKIHPHYIIWIWWCKILVYNLVMIKLNSAHVWLNKTWLTTKYLTVGVQMEYASNHYIPFTHHPIIPCMSSKMYILLHYFVTPT